MGFVTPATPSKGTVSALHRFGHKFGFVVSRGAGRFGLTGWKVCRGGNIRLFFGKEAAVTLAALLQPIGLLLLWRRYFGFKTVYGGGLVWCDRADGLF